ncbi:TetR family transcriptional regulator [Pectobacterium sp. B1J-3]|uniref:TetR family transcriptional regulator n=1 Tax=Pectobacterium sp. B1J-3 TaxID=3385371 RepID=UPI003905DEA3
MARKKTIDNGLILDAAEKVLLQDGVHHFTLDAVAAQAGISKGGLVYRFPSKDQLIQAILCRELTRFEQEVQYRSTQYTDREYADVLGHIAAIRQEDEETTSHAIGLLTALIHSPEMLAPIRKFYRDKLDRLSDNTLITRRIRLAFLATEGVFLLHGMGFSVMSREEQHTILADAHALCQSNQDDGAPLLPSPDNVSFQSLATSRQNMTPLADNPIGSKSVISWLVEKGVISDETGQEKIHARAAHIVDTATTIIKREGIEALTHRAVAMEANVPLGSTTYHFNSMDDMLNAVMRHAIALFRDDMFCWFYQRRHTDPRDVLTDFVMRGAEDIDDLAREYTLFTAAISRPSLRPIALEWSNTVVAILKMVVPDAAALPLGTLMNGFFIRAMLEKHERTLPREQVYQAIAALYDAFQ